MSRVFQYNGFQTNSFQVATFPYTLGDIAYKAAIDILGRPDLYSSALEFAMMVYMEISGALPFDELRQSTTVNLVSGTDTYSLTSIGMYGIVNIRINYSSTDSRRLKRTDNRVYDAICVKTSGRPSSYARYGTSIVLNPKPDSSSYTLTVRYWGRPVISNEVEETPVVLPLEWYELLIWETVHRLYLATDQPQKAMVLVQTKMLPSQASPKKTRSDEMGIIPRLWNNLLSNMSFRENIDEDFSLHPVVRRYTSNV